MKTLCSAGWVLWFTHSLWWLQSTVNQARLPNHTTCPMEKKGFELCLGKRKMSASMRSRALVERERDRESVDYRHPPAVMRAWAVRGAYVMTPLPAAQFRPCGTTCKPADAKTYTLTCTLHPHTHITDKLLPSPLLDESHSLMFLHTHLNSSNQTFYIVYTCLTFVWNKIICCILFFILTYSEQDLMITKGCK